MSWLTREAKRLGEVQQIEDAENDALNARAREVRAENIRRVALANRGRS